MILNKENTFTEQNRFLVYSDQLNATRKQILDETEEMISRAAIQTFEDEGETVTATDASYLASLIVDGKAVQDGTPTPSNPIPIQVVGLNSDNEFGIQIGETLYPIDLQGNVLASLPDGTKDILTVDAGGHVVLTKNIAQHTCDGSENWGVHASIASWFFVDWLVPDMDYSKGNSGIASLSNTYAFIPYADVGSIADNQFSFGIVAVNGNKRIVVKETSVTTKDAFKTWLASNNLTFMYPLTTPQTIDLGYISMPAIPDGSTISITAQVTPTIAAKWWTKNQSGGAAAFGAVSSDLAALQDEISALDVRVTALESANAKTLVLGKPETVKETPDAL